VAGVGKKDEAPRRVYERIGQRVAEAKVRSLDETGYRPLRQVFIFLRRNVEKLSVAIGMIAALARLTVGLQAIVLRLQDTSDDICGDGMPLLFQSSGQMRQTPRRPEQRLHRRSARVGFDESLQIVDEGRPMHDFFLRPPPLRLCR